MKTLLIIGIMLTSFGANAQSELIQLTKLDSQRGKTQILAYMDAMPEGHLGYKPTPETRSFAEQMLRIAPGTAGLVSNDTAAQKPFTENLENVEKYTSKEEIKRLVTESFDFALNSVDNLSSDNYLNQCKKVLIMYPVLVG